MDIKQSHLSKELTYDHPLLACRFSPSGQQVVTTAEDSTLQRWDLSSGAKVVLKGHESWVHAICYSPDGSQLLSGGCDGRLIWWPIVEAVPQAMRTVEAHAGWIRALDISPDGSRVASVGNDLMIRLWDRHSGERLAQWSQHQKHIYSVLFTADGKHLLTGDLEGKIHVWVLENQELVRTLDAKALHTYEGGQRVDFGGVRALSLSVDGSQVLAGGLHKATNPLGAVHEPLLLRFQFADGTLLKSHVCDGIPGGVLWRTATLPDGVTVAVCGGSTGGFLLYFSSEQEKDIHRFKLPSLARDMDFHSASKSIATVHHDRYLRITGLFAKPT